jgi:hypothetical protein
MAGQVFRHGRLCDVDAQLLQLAVNARCAPQWVSGVHLPDQDAHVVGWHWAAGSSRRRSPMPVEGEPATMPAHDRVGPHDLKRASPAPPPPRQEHPEPAIGVAKPRALWRLPLEDGELMPEGENLRPELETPERQTGGRRTTP